MFIILELCKNLVSRLEIMPEALRLMRLLWAPVQDGMASRLCVMSGLLILK